MKVSKEQSALNRSALVTAATQLFQQQGFGATGVAQISEQAGLTQGGFYGHFKTKSLLAEEACRQQFEQSRRGWLDTKGTTDDDLAGLIDAYVSIEHVDTPGEGCPMTAYAGEVKSQEPPVQAAFSLGFEQMVEVLQETLACRGSSETTREQALFLMCSMVGSVAMARATNMTSPALAEEILQATRDGLKVFANSIAAEAPPTRE